MYVENIATSCQSGISFFSDARVVMGGFPNYNFFFFFIILAFFGTVRRIGLFHKERGDVTKF